MSLESIDSVLYERQLLKKAQAFGLSNVVAFQEITIVERGNDFFVEDHQTYLFTESDDSEDKIEEFDSGGGGTIIFSPEINDKKINAVKTRLPKMINSILTKAKIFIKKKEMKIKSVVNARRVDDILLKAKEPVEKKHKVSIFWTRSSPNTGVWVSPETGRKVKERSYMLHVFDVPIAVVLDLAREIRRDFEQRSVLVIDRDKPNKTISISGDIPGEDIDKPEEKPIEKPEKKKSKVDKAA